MDIVVLVGECCYSLLDDRRIVIVVPIDETPGISILYVFVDIQVNVQHIIDTLKHHFTAESKLALVSTIQFVRTLQVCNDSVVFS